MRELILALSVGGALAAASAAAAQGIEGSWCQVSDSDTAPPPVNAGTCPTPPYPSCATCSEGPCDNADFRNSFIVGGSTPLVTIRVQFHVFCEDDGSGCVASFGQVSALVDLLNAAFQPAKIAFSAHLRFVNDSDFVVMNSFGEAPPAEEYLMKEAYAINPETRVNVYVTDLPGSTLGDAIQPWTFLTIPFQQGGIMIDPTVVNGSSHAMTHEMGHALGLWHTFRGNDPQEVAVCSSCWDCPGEGLFSDCRGDLCADTPPASVNFFCQQQAGQDLCSGLTLPNTIPSNYMSLGPHSTCINHFTAQQMARMHCWIQDAVPGWQAGQGPPLTIQVPSEFPTLAEAIFDASPGSTIVIADGLYTGPENYGQQLDKSLTIRSENGPANCTIQCASADRAFHITGSGTQVVLDGLSIQQGRADFGAGVLVDFGAQAVIDDCDIRSGLAIEAGAGIAFIDGTSLTVQNSTIIGNAAIGSGIERRGGGLYLVMGNDSDVQVINSIIAENTAKREGAGVYVETGSLQVGAFELRHCTLASNVIVAEGQSVMGAGVFVDEPVPVIGPSTIANCIVWGNEVWDSPTAPQGDQIAFAPGNNITEIRYCDIEGGLSLIENLDVINQWGPGNIQANPVFVDAGPVGGDYHVKKVSPCINTGDPGYTPFAGEKDIDGQARILQGRVEIGADERRRPNEPKKFPPGPGPGQ